jgi:hypothetical protein
MKGRPKLPPKFADSLNRLDERQAARESLPEINEKGLQRQVEQWLSHAGYAPRNKHTLADPSPMPRSGWYVHLFKPMDNAIILDLLIFSKTGRYLELELKTSKGRLKPHQGYLVERDPNCKLARSLDEAVLIVQEWERQA